MDLFEQEKQGEAQPQEQALKQSPEQSSKQILEVLQRQIPEEDQKYIPQEIQNIVQNRQQVNEQNVDEVQVIEIHSLNLNNSDVRENMCFATQPETTSIQRDREVKRVTCLSESNISRRRKKEKAMEAVEIDSKENSVQEVRQPPPQQYIVLQPQEVPPGCAIVLENGREADPAVDPQIEPLPNDMLSKLALSVHPDLRASTFSHVIKQKEGDLPEVLHQSMVAQVPPAQDQQNPQFDDLFMSTQDKMRSIVQQLHEVQVEEGDVLEIPNELAPLVASRTVPVPVMVFQQICQQFLMVTMADYINSDDLKMEVKNLIKSNAKEIICRYILGRLGMVDLTYNYSNVGVLQKISSGWVWDNTIPFMAEMVYKHYQKLRIRMLPQRCNGYSVALTKFQIFILMSQMFLGILMRQIPSSQLPITFGEIMMVGESDLQHSLDNKLNKLKCLLHYFSGILRDKENTIEASRQSVVFQRFRMAVKPEVLYPQTQDIRIKYSNLRLSSHLKVSVIGANQRRVGETVVYLTHQNLCRESREEEDGILFLMQESYLLMYTKPEMFVLKALTARLDLGEAIAVHGLEQFSMAQWHVEQSQFRSFYSEKWYFSCEGLYREEENFDQQGKRKGTVIFILSGFLFSQSFISNHGTRYQKIENFSPDKLKNQIDTLFSAFQTHKSECREEYSILISEKNIKFIEEDCKWLYFILTWVAASMARVRVQFEFKNDEDRCQAAALMRHLRGMEIWEVMYMLHGYGETLIESYSVLEREKQLQKKFHQLNEDERNQLEELKYRMSRFPSAFSELTLLQYIKNLY